MFMSIMAKKYIYKPNLIKLALLELYLRNRKYNMSIKIDLPEPKL